MEDPSHCFNDEELKCLLEARRMFKENCGECDKCLRGWALIDQAILAKYTVLAQQDKKEKEHGRNSMD
jgi:hypothetical protein